LSTAQPARSCARASELACLLIASVDAAGAGRGRFFVGPHFRDAVEKGLERCRRIDRCGCRSALGFCGATMLVMRAKG
jgi:hypothetical protein